MPDFDFVGQAYEAASITQNDQALVNWYCEIDQTKFAGSKSTGVGADTGRGIFNRCMRPEGLFDHAGLRGYRSRHAGIYDWHCVHER